MKDTDWIILSELYKNPNMTKVANLLYMTQPSLTKRLQHIEEEFGVTVVNRTSKGLFFTKEGEFLAKQADSYLAFMKETRDTLKEFRTNNEEMITIGASYTFNKFVLTDLLIPYRLSHPQVNFNVISEPSDVLFRKMLEGVIDVGFIRGDYEGDFYRRLIGKDRAYLITKEPVEIEQLPSMNRIGYKTNDKSLEILDAWWRETFGVEPPGSMVVGYVDVAWQLIDRGLGYCVCFLPDNFVNQYNLILTPLCDKEGKAITRNTWFIHSRDKRISPCLSEFIGYVESAAKGDSQQLS